MRIFFILTFVLSSADHIHLVQVASLSRVILFIGGYHGEEAMPEAHRICERTTARYGQACLNYLLFDEDEAKIALQATLSPGGDRHNTFVFELAAGIEQFPEVWGASDPGNLRPIADRLNVLIQPSVVLRHNYTDLVVDVHDADFPVLRGIGTLLMELPIERAVIETSTASMHGNQALNEIVGLVMQNAGFICVEGCLCKFHCNTGFVRLPSGQKAKPDRIYTPPPPQSSPPSLLGRIGSQVGQDEWVLKMLGHKRNGTFVDVGAHDGEYNSNTVLMERVYGWRGICVEANPVTHASLSRHRSCEAVDVVLGDGRVVDFCDLGEVGGIVGLEDQAYSVHREHATNQRAVQSVPLADVLDAVRAPRTIDYLSIDIEGAEFLVLHTFPFDRYRFRTITVEHNAPHIGDGYQRRLRVLLESNGYRWSQGNTDLQSWGHGPIDDFYMIEEYTSTTDVAKRVV